MSAVRFREYDDQVVLSPPAKSGGFVHVTLDGRPAARGNR